MSPHVNNGSVSRLQQIIASRLQQCKKKSFSICFPQYLKTNKQ
jgi:hypothetical protein